MHLPCKQVKAGALPAVLHQFINQWSVISNQFCASLITLPHMRGTRLKHRDEPHKLIQVGVIPTPATNLRISSMESLSKAVVLSSNEPKTPMPSPTSGQTARGVEATCSGWNRGSAGASPAALTDFPAQWDKSSPSVC